MNCVRSLTAHGLRPTISCSGPTVLSRGLRLKAGDDGAARVRTIESMPFQTYQLALKVIRADRLEKMEAVAYQRKKIADIVEREGDKVNHHRIKELTKHLEYLQIQADINNPRVKYNFDRGTSTMTPPRHRRRL